MKYKCIIIDNNEHSTQILTSHIREHPYLELIKAYTNSILALSEIMEGENIDFIFIDTEMPGFNGIKLGKIARTKTIHLIFTSSHSNYAVESYEINALGYLLKPINTVKFASAINGLILPKKALAITNSTPSVEAYFFVRTEV